MNRTTGAPLMHPTSRPARLIAAAAIAALALFATACGDDEESADTTASTTTTQALEPCTEVYAAETAAPEGADAIEGRGAPEMAACDPEVSELEVIDVVEGSGAEVAAGATVTAHYSGVSASTGEEFDSSWSRGEAASFPLDGVIQGWSEGLVGMKEGGRRTLIIPAEMAYGQSPPPGSGIAPGETLVFTVDMVAVS
jgi:peptidylprolyl isomerase